MPYTITATTPEMTDHVTPGQPWPRTITRHAVTTPAKAHRWIECEYAWSDFRVLDGEIPCTIGPLPDGTTIVVEMVSRTDLDGIALELDLSRWASADEWCNAYNVAQGA